MRAIPITFVFVVTLAFGAGWYVLYHTITSSRLSKIESFNAIVDVPASVCKSASANATGSGEGTLYVYKNRVVLDVMTIPWNDTPAHLRVLIDSERNYRLDPESSEAIPPGLSADKQKAYIDNIIFSNTWNCAPWWLPDDSLFNSFLQGAGSVQ